MKRIEQLVILSREHHQGLVAAQHAIQLKSDASVASIQQQWLILKTYLQEQAEQHFSIEERFLLEPLREFEQCADLIARIYDDHKQLLAFAEAPLGTELTAVQAAGELLKAHIKFEEKIVFPSAQALLSTAQLDAVLAAQSMRD